ncbi:MAG: GtrA family protein [Caulobacterales bacterium]|nr:GtrA family protein [Caulobacterales bacterium]
MSALRHRAVTGEFIRFAIVGAAGALVDMSVLALALNVLMVGPYAGRLLSYLAAATFTWAVNRKFTFRGGTQASLFSQWLRYIVISAGGGVVNLGVFSAIVAVGRAHLGEGTLAATLLPYFGVACGSVSGLMVNFLATKRLIFRSS